jgi:uncharacterized OB-fold protein
MSQETVNDTADWTHGVEAILYQDCAVCGAIWYFRRDFCPYCGSTHIAKRRASGQGTVHATTLVTRAPSAELRALAPYLIILVDAKEGFRMMAHGDKSLRIGDAVRARFIRFADRLLPYFERSV